MELSVIGKSVRRVDTPEKARGDAIFCTDMNLPGMLHGRVLRSPYPHARIRTIDTSRAEQLRGVRGIVTGRDAPDHRIGRTIFDKYAIARDEVRFVGEPVAAVAADTLETAEEALGLIKVDYEELPALFDPELAMSKTPPVVLHPDLANYGRLERSKTEEVRFDPERPNAYYHMKVRRGDVEGAFREADLVVENKYTTARLQHCALEPHGAIARAERDGGVTIWMGRQGIQRVRLLLAQVFGIPSSKLRMIELYAGGGFGSKALVEPAPFAVMLALKTGKPVKVILTRPEVFCGTSTRIPTVITIKDGVTRDGRLIAREMTMILASGAYTATSPFVVRKASFGAVGSYNIPNFRWDSYGVYTNEPIGSGFRGFGNSQTLFAVESQMDILARELKMDPVAFRLRNLLREGEPNATGEITHSIGARQCVEKVVECMKSWGKLERTRGSWRIGRGLSVINRYSTAPITACATVKVYEDGAVEVRHAGDEIGQGCNTVMAQIVAEEFGISMDDVRTATLDTAVVPFFDGTGSQKTTYNLGNAVQLACRDAKRKLAELASARLEVPPEELDVKAGRVYMREKPEIGINIPHLFKIGGSTAKEGELLGTATFTQECAPEDPETGQIDPELARKGMRLVSFFTHGAQGVEVAVDLETGQVKVLKCVQAFDMGQPINPKMCEEQMDGGMGMGIGSSIYEEMIMDSGRVLNSSFLDYRIPTAKEIPSGENVKSIIAATPHKDGPFGAKGMGEAVMTPTAPAIGNAIYDAVGIRMTELPMSPERVLRKLRDEARSEKRQ